MHNLENYNLLVIAAWVAKFAAAAAKKLTVADTVHGSSSSSGITSQYIGRQAEIYGS
jgi:hypothetical protein